MLAVSNYPKQYVKETRAKIERQLAAYEKLAAKAEDEPLAEFEPLCFNHLVLALDHYFMHRTRGVEGKDGNPINEVRILCSSLMENDGTVVADKQIKLKPESSVLGYEVGDEIALDAAAFRRLSTAFLDEIEARFPEEK